MKAELLLRYLTCVLRMAGQAHTPLHMHIILFAILALGPLSSQGQAPTGDALVLSLRSHMVQATVTFCRLETKPAPSSIMTDTW